MNAGMSKHEPDAVSLVFGGLFLAVAAWWLVARIVDVDLPNLGWVAGAALVAVGVLGLWTALGPSRRQGS
jgi:uncharacterized membrane protein HdeD (DUF308 family)